MPHLLGGRLLGGLRDLLYPEVCAGCDRVGEGTFCDHCRSAVTPVKAPYCRWCGRPCDTGLCSTCLAVRPPFAAARAAGLFLDPLARAIRQLKYHGREHTSTGLVPMLVEAYWDWEILRPVDLVLPLPITHGRERRRGYNQSALLAEALALEVGLEYLEGALTRPVHRPPQVGLSRTDRAANVKGVFRVPLPALVAGRRVLLVDDVMTTGATLTEASKALLLAGAKSVSALTLAREP